MVAHITHLALRKNRVGWLLHGIAIGAGNAPAARQAVYFVGSYVRADKNIEHAGRSFGSGQVDAFDVGMCVWRAHKHRMALVGQCDVIGVLAAACQKTIVFLTTN